MNLCSPLSMKPHGPLSRTVGGWATRDSLAQIGATQQLGEDRLRAIDDGEGEAREPSDLNAVATIGGARNDAADEDDLVVPLLYRDGEIPHARQVFLDLREFQVVRRKQGARSAFAVQVLNPHG